MPPRKFCSHSGPGGAQDSGKVTGHEPGVSLQLAPHSFEALTESLPLSLLFHFYEIRVFGVP